MFGTTSLTASMVWLLSAGAATAPLAFTTPTASTLKVETLDRPLGLDVPRPRLSWLLIDPRQGARQTGYRILVATRPDLLQEGRADVWDSGKVASDRSVDVAYAGKPLEARQRYWWRVRIWDAGGTASPYSEPSWWETGLMAPEGRWSAPWIAAPDTAGPLPLFRKTFSVAKPIARARVYVTALGSYRLSLNGGRVGRDILTPEWTDYARRVTYQTYDVTPLIRPGENALGALLGNGWYGGPLGWNHMHYPFGPAPLRLSVELHLTYRDGSESVVRSDSTWRTTPGPIVRSTIYGGETYDARRVPTGWDRAGFDAAAWSVARVLPATEAAVTAQRSPTIQATDTLVPRSRTSPEPGVHIYDLGQNMVGWVRLKVRGPAGTVVRLRFAEVLDSTGRLSTFNLRKAEATDVYTLRGGGVEVFEPHFTYHGFRYVEVTGYPGTPPADAIRGIVFHTAAPFTGRFTTSDSTVNQLWRNILWGQRGNLHSVPTDCPQRDERLGWMGDAQGFWRTASYNMDMRAFSAKWLTDIGDARTDAGCYPNFAPALGNERSCGAPGWADAGIIIPWTVYRHYGDTTIVNANWAAMHRYMGFIRDSNPTLLVTRPEKREQFGDWVPAASTSSPSLTGPTLIATAYFAYDAALMAEMASATGRPADAARYRAMADSIETAFAAAFVREDGAVGEPFVNRMKVRSDVTQTSIAMALYMGLVPEERRAAAAARLVKEIEGAGWHLTTGFLGTPYLLPALSEHGQNDAAYRLLFQETYPSWFHMIRKGATTMWERWDGDRVVEEQDMNSYNHFAFGAVAEWLYRYVAGIDTQPGAAGFKRIRIHPRPNPRLRHVKGEYDSPYGTIVSEWRLAADGTFSLTATLPPNTSGTIVLPTGERHEVAAGTHRYTVKHEVGE